VDEVTAAWDTGDARRTEVAELPQYQQHDDEELKKWTEPLGWLLRVTLTDGRVFSVYSYQSIEETLAAQASACRQKFEVRLRSIVDSRRALPRYRATAVGSF